MRQKVWLYGTVLDVQGNGKFGDQFWMGVIASQLIVFDRG